MKKSDITIGMKFYRNMYNPWRSKTSKEIKELTVETIGNKYMKMNNGDKVTIETLRHDDKVYSQHSYQLYLTPNEIEDMRERDMLLSIIKAFFAYENTNGLSLEQLRTIKEIVRPAK